MIIHSSKRNQSIFIHLILLITRNQSTPRNQIFLRHFAKQLTSLTHITSPTKQHDHRIRGNYIPFRHPIKNIPRLLHISRINITCQDWIPWNRIKRRTFIEQLTRIAQSPTNSIHIYQCVIHIHIKIKTHFKHMTMNHFPFKNRQTQRTSLN